MSLKITWKLADIQRVNNYLIIKGREFLKSGDDPNSVYRACYALPSDPNEMDDWVSIHLDEDEAQVLYDFLFS
jgi:hypothetical protein